MEMPFFAWLMAGVSGITVGQVMIIALLIVLWVQLRKKR
jgi:hypothetical protein